MNFIVSYADRCQAAQQASFRAGEGRTRPHRWLVETVDRGRLTGKVVYRLRVTAVKDSKKCSVCPSPEVLVHDSAARKPSRPPTPPHISDTICTKYAPQGVASPTPFYIYRRTSRSNQAVPADLPPALVCLQYGLRPCHPFIAHHGSCVLHLFSSGVLL